jgi:hypothetical protein
MPHSKLNDGASYDETQHQDVEAWQSGQLPRCPDNHLPQRRRHRHHNVFRRLANDQPPTVAIAGEIEHAASQGHKVLLFAERTGHLDAISAGLDGKIPPPFVVLGRMSRWQRAAILAVRRFARPTVTNAVAQREKRLGVRLLHRTTRRLSLTEEGRTYYESFVRILGDLAETEDSLSSARSSPCGRLRASTPNAFIHQAFLAALPGFLARYPHLKLDLVVTDRAVCPKTGWWAEVKAMAAKGTSKSADAIPLRRPHAAK